MEQKTALTPTCIETLEAGQLADVRTPGLFIEAKSGRGRTTRVWKFRRRIAGGRTAGSLKATLGPFPTYSIAAAREWATKLNESAERGIDPKDIARQERASHLTVCDAHRLYISSVSAGRRRKLKPRTIFDKEQIWSCDMKRQIGDKVLQELTDDDLWALVLEKGATAPIRANRLAAELKVFLKWCSGRSGKEAGVIMTANPATTLDANYYPSRPRARHLSHEELGWLLESLAPEKRVHQRAVLLLLLTGCRKEEVLRAPTDEVINDVWTLSPERTKNRQIHRIPLSPWGRSLAATDEKWLIPSSTKDGPMLAGWYKVLSRIRGRMEELAGRKIPHFTYHDLRRTLRSNTKRMKIDFEVAEAMLNHKKKGLAEIYDGYDLFDEKRDGFALWERMLVGLALRANVAEKLSIPDESKRSFDQSLGPPASPQLQAA